MSGISTKKERGEYRHTEERSTEGQSAKEEPVEEEHSEEELAGEELVEEKFAVEDSATVEFVKENSVKHKSQEEDLIEEQSIREGSTREGSTRRESAGQGPVGYQYSDYAKLIGFEIYLGNRPKDLPAVWRYIECVLFILLEEGSRPETNVHYTVHTAVHNFCTSLSEDTVSDNGAELYGKELYINLSEYVKLHLQQVAQSLVGRQPDSLVRHYNQQWNQFETALTVIPAMFRYLDRHWVKRERYEERKDVYEVRSLMVIHWKRTVSEPLKEDLVPPLLHFVNAQRDHTKIFRASPRGSASRNDEASRHTDVFDSADGNSLMKSIVESFVSITRTEPETNGNFYKEYFENDFLIATKEYYDEEARILRDSWKLDMPGYAHWVLNRLSVEKSFMPTDSSGHENWYGDFVTTETDKMVLPRLLETFHDSFYTSKLGEYYQNLQRQKQTNPKSEELLMAAGLKAHDDMVELLVGSREGLEQTDCHGQTALHYAVLADNIPLIKALLKLDAPTHIRDRDKQTAGHLAVMKKNLAALNCLFVRPACFTVLNGEHRNGKTIGALIKSKLYHKSDPRWDEALRGAGRLEKAAWLFNQPLEPNESDHTFQPTIVQIESEVFTSPHVVNLEKMLNTDAYYQKEMGSGGSAKWLHFPANNMRWVELLMLQYGRHQKALLFDGETGAYKDDPRTLGRDDILSEQLWRCRLHTGFGEFAHARYMKPLCEQIGSSEGSYVFMMPYIHWEFADTFDSLTTYAKQLTTSSTDISEPNPPARYQNLMKLYMPHQDWLDGADSGHIYKHGRRSIRQLHIRRSLDQYHYHALSDTRSRDNDQLVSRMFDRTRNYHLKDRQVLMVVDQLWLWNLKGNTVFTGFTERWSRDPIDDSEDTTDVFENIMLDRSPVRTMHDLAGKIILKSLTSCLDSTTNTAPNLQFLEFYSTETGRLADEEASRLKRFRRTVMEVSNEKQPRVRNDEHEEPECQSGSATPEKPEAGENPAEGDELDVAGDILLLEQIKDIQDELHMIKILIQDQTSVIDKFCEINENVDFAEKAKRTVRDYRVEVESIITRADHTYRMLSDLLDLKQKYANVQEARSSRQQAEETAKQGKTIMVFTIVTIVFLPLSFMAAFFAIQVKEFEELSLGFVSKIMFPVSLAFVIPLVYLAFSIDGVSKRFSEKTKKRKDGETPVRLYAASLGSTRRRNVTSDEESQTRSHQHSS